MPKAHSTARVSARRNAAPTVKLYQHRLRQRAIDGGHGYLGLSRKHFYSFAHEYAHWTADFALYSNVAKYLGGNNERQKELAAMIDGAADRIEPDEDDEACAEDYPIASPETRSLAKGLALRIAQAAIAINGSSPLIPRFSSAGSVDLHWRSERVELLVTVSAEAGAGVLFYGDTPGGASIKGSLRIDEKVDFLARWLVDHELPGRSHSGQRVPIQMGQA